MITIEELDLIEKYINKELDDSSKKAFEARLNKDILFLQVYRDIIDIQSSVREIGRDKIRDKIKQIASEYKKELIERRQNEDEKKTISPYSADNERDNSKIIVGLDIGSSKIYTIVGRKNEFGKIEILGYGKCESLGVTRGVVTNRQYTINCIKSSVLEATSFSRVEIEKVYVGIGGQHIKSLQCHGQKIRSSLEEKINQSDIDAIIEDMYKLAMPPGEEIIHVIPLEYIVDNQQGIKNPIGMSGIRLEANCHIITGQVTAVKNIYNCVSKAGLHIEGLFLQPMASSEAVLTEEEKEAGVVLVDIGSGTTDIAIFQDGVIRHTAIIPFGGNVITGDIKEGCSIIFSQAELLKIRFGCALASETQDNETVSIPGLRGREPKDISVKYLANIIQARMEEIIEHVFYEIKNSSQGKKINSGIVLTGGGAQLKYIVQLFEFITGMETRIGFPNLNLVSKDDELIAPSYSAGIGLIIKGSKEIENMKENDALKQSQHSVKQSQKVKGRFFDVIIEKSGEEDNKGI